MTEEEQEEDWNAFDHFDTDPEDHLESLQELTEIEHMCDVIPVARKVMDDSEFNLFTWELAGSIHPTIPDMIDRLELYLEDDLEVAQ